MTQLDRYQEVKDHNDRILALWGSGEITRLEALASVKLLKNVGDLQKFKVLQPRGEGARGILQATTTPWYKGPLQVILEALKNLPDCVFPYSKDGGHV